MRTGEACIGACPPIPAFPRQGGRGNDDRSSIWFPPHRRGRVRVGVDGGDFKIVVPDLFQDAF